MNHIEVQDMQTPYGYTDNYWVIDGKALPQYLDTWAKESQDAYLTSFGSLLGLYPAWNRDLTWSGDVRFVWKVITMDSAVLPLLLCEEDTDFSCMVIVADVEKTKDFVYWNRIGYVLHDKESFEEERKCGILYTDSYSEEDWEKYGDNIALETVGSPLWKQWISDYWEEELYRRRMNYTLPFYQTEGNIRWVRQADWVFDRTEYDKMVSAFWERQTVKAIRQIAGKGVLHTVDCAHLLADLTMEGRQALEAHKRSFHDILLHILAGELMNEPLLDLLKYHMDRKDTIQMYCEAVEAMWKYGDDAVKNVVDVTILEGLSDDPLVWQRFGTFLSREFRQYIHEQVLKSNSMKILKGLN